MLKAETHVNKNQKIDYMDTRRVENNFEKKKQQHLVIA